MFYNKHDFNSKIIPAIIKNLDQEDLNRIYYKNNLEEFCKNSLPKEHVLDFLTCVDVYVNPAESKTPPELKGKLDNYWDILKEYVLYDYGIIDKVHRVVNMKRKRVLVIDTDSNMVHVGKWIEFLYSSIITDEIKEEKEGSEDFTYVMIYTLCFLLSKMIRQVLDTYLKSCNVKKENRKLLDMKNEYLFLRMLITQAKKSYASTVKYKEGKDMGGKMSIAGLQINKSSTNRIASKKFKSILENDILNAEKIDVVKILTELHDFEHEIRNSLRAGERTFLKPTNVKDVMAYADPLTNGGYRGAMVWNMLNETNQIVLPDSFFLVKLTLLKPDMLEIIEDEFVRETLKEQIFNSPEPRIRSKGVYMLAIPRDESIPDWAIPFIDEDTIVEDTMKSFMAVLKALSLNTVSKTSGSEEFSNIIAI